MKPAFSLLSSSEIERIRESALKILDQKGLRFTVPEVLSVFRKAGFTITDSNIVHISEGELEHALHTAPKSFTRHGAAADRDVQIGSGDTKFGIGSIPLWVIEGPHERHRRPAGIEDFRRFTLLSEALESYQIGNPVVQPRDIPAEVMHLLWNRNVAVRMTKPACCWYGTSFETAREGLEILRLAAGGMDQLRGCRRWAVTICPDSALQWGKSAIGVLIMAEAEIPIDVLPMPFLGSMYPVTLAGALVQATAEVMAIVVLSQLLRPGCPVLYAASYGGIMDMATGAHALGAPESSLFAAAASEIGRSFGLPTNMMQGSSDSKLPDQQAGVEKMLTYLLSTLAGADCVTMAGALLDFALTASCEQLVVEDEMIRWVRRIMRGAPVDRSTLAEDEILSLPYGGNYIESEHTLHFFRDELLATKLFDRRSWELWQDDGAKDIIERAGDRVREILEITRFAQGIPDIRQREVDTFVAELCEKRLIDPAPLLF